MGRGLREAVGWRRVWAEDGGRLWDEEGMGRGWREGVG